MKILIVAPYQFGELSDCFYWAKYAKLNGVKVAYFGYKYRDGRQKRERHCDGVNIVGIPRINNTLIFGMYFYAKLIMTIIFGNYRNIIICYMPYASIIPKLFPKRNIILDIRTLSVSPDNEIRENSDNRLRRTAQSFNKISYISTGVMCRLGIKNTKNYILPLGAEHISNKVKDFSQMRLLYIGTFNNRNLSDFITGLQLFQCKYDISYTFDIIGGGDREEEKKIRNALHSQSKNNIRFHGYMTHEEAKPYFDTCNIGVCYVPITEYYNDQPPTKLYEYLLSGMASIATRTKSNIDIITEDSGVLIDDNPKSVCDNLYRIYTRMRDYDSKKIIEQNRKYHWSSIVSDVFLKIFE